MGSVWLLQFVALIRSFLEQVEERIEEFFADAPPHASLLKTGMRCWSHRCQWGLTNKLKRKSWQSWFTPLAQRFMSWGRHMCYNSHLFYSSSHFAQIRSWNSHLSRVISWNLLLARVLTTGTSSSECDFHSNMIACLITKLNKKHYNSHERNQNGWGLTFPFKRP